MAILDEIELLLARPPQAAGALYQRIAHRYDDFRSLWLALAGRGAEDAMIADLEATLAPGCRVLDAGAGTGAIARQIQAIEPTAAITMLDLSPAMLEHARDIPATRVVGDVLNLPFLDDEFDIIVSAWVIETVPDPIRAVSEYLRVLAPTGHLFYTFCSLPQGWLSRTGSAWLRSIIKNRFAGNFLPPQRTPWHDCNHSHLHRSHHGLVTEIALQKCCTVNPPPVPTATTAG